MPYIKKEDKIVINAGASPENAGELNYCITRLINDYIIDKGLKYQTLNDIRGALENSTSEFYDRIVRPYENKKIIENGDAYDESLIKRVNEPKI